MIVYFYVTYEHHNILELVPTMKGLSFIKITLQYTITAVYSYVLGNNY